MWLMVNANGYTFDAEGRRFDAVAVADGRIAAVGTQEELTLQFGARAQVVDMDGATVIPGLVDSHIHIAETGKQTMQLNLSGSRSKAEMLDSIRSYAATLDGDSWVLGGGWNENAFPDKAVPTRQELDDVAGGRPLLLTRICHHAYLANSAAFARAGLGLTPDNPEDGQYGRDESGRVNGYVYENAVVPLARAVPKMTAEQWRQAVRVGMNSALAAGLTGVHTDDTRSFGNFTDTWLAYRSLIDNDKVLLRVHELVDWHVIDEANRALPDLPPPDEWLERGAAKLFSDGALGGRTAWFSEAYSDAPGWHGTAMYTPDELRRRVHYAHEQGFPAAIHAIGDAALEATLGALEGAPAVAGRDRIVHAEVVRPDLVARMAQLGSRLAVDIQPRFVCSDFPWVIDRVGAHRSPFVCAWRELAEANLHLCGGSDSPIEPLQPLLGIHAAVTRRPPYAEDPGYYPEQRLTTVEAIRLFSQDACYANGSEAEKGVIAKGWQADFTVLDRDIVAPGDVDDIRDAKVLHTIVGGEFAYSWNQSDSQWFSA